MFETILKVENLSKQYRLGLVGTGTLSHDLNRWWHRIRGKEDPYLKIGETNDRSTKGESEYVWALRDINFEVKRGEVLGIIGKNGAGKSTLLKILSRVTSPTTGSIKTKGRIASLLEVGTGFHGEMTGRENIYLNGAILGMTKKEITAKIDEIIEFSGCERYIDTPVKRYSSGMTVRLAFAVAAFLEPDILIVDEVLAVGDAEFQKKAIGKMQDISSGEGRTVLFVSHNMISIHDLCNRVLILEDGMISKSMITSEGIAYYLKNVSLKAKKDSLQSRKLSNNCAFLIEDVKIQPEQGFPMGELTIKIKYNNKTKREIKEVGVSIWDAHETRLISLSSSLKNDLLELDCRQGTFICKIFELPLVEGSYFVSVFVSLDDGYMDYLQKVRELIIVRSDYFSSGNTIDPLWGKVIVNHKFSNTHYDTI